MIYLATTYSKMESCYIPNNPQFGLAVEYTAFNNGASFTSALNGISTHCDSGVDTDGAILCCNGSSLQGCSSCGVGAGEDLEDPLRLACDGIGSHCCDDFQNCDACNLNNCEDLDNDDELNGLTDNCDSETLNHVNLIGNCDERCGDEIDSGLNTCAQSDENRGSSSSEVIIGDSLVNAGLLGPGGPSSAFWTSDDMASFSLPSFDLDPLPGLFPFSPSSAGYNPHRPGSDCRERTCAGPGGEVADVLLSLKHAVVHSGQGAEPSNHAHHTHPQITMPQQMVLSPSNAPHTHPYYEQYGAAPPMFPTMSLNVSMNMTMHGYPPDQLCPQMQWNQTTSTSPVNVMYPQTQNVLSSSSYPGAATYSFTADFRTQNQTDPLITASTSFKPLTAPCSSISQKTMPNNYNLFSQRSTPTSFSSYNTNQRHLSSTQNVSSHIRTRSASKLNSEIDQNVLLNGYSTELHSGSNGNLPEYGYPNLNLQLSSGGNIQIESPGSESGSDDDESKPNLCRICGKTYARPSTLKTHLRTHSGERPYRCGDCNKSFSQAANLTAHVRTHTGQKPFRCSICDRRFSQSSSVTTHMRTHSGERPYRCRACKKAFSDSSTLTKHLRIHSGEKPYQCKLCLLRFSQSGNLNRHMRVHGNNSALFT